MSNFKERVGSIPNNNQIMDTANSAQDNATISSSTSNRRKSSKPIMEKRRRARINASLTELKSFLLDMIKKEGLRHNKMEKADILELTVKHLRQLQKQRFNVDNEKSHDTFVQGFSECASEVTSFLNSMPDLESSVQARLLEHLSRCTDIDKRPKEVKARITWNNITDHPKQVLDDRMQCSSTIASQNGVFNKQTECISNLNRTIKPSLNTLGTMHNSLDKVTPCVNTIQNGNSILQTGNVISGLQLVPTRLQSGQMAYIIPTSFVTSTCIPNCVVPMQTSTKLTNTPPAVIPIIDVNTPTHSFSSSSIPLVQTLENKNRRPDISNQGMNDIYFVGIQQKMEKNVMTSDLKGDPRNSRDIHTDTNCHLTINGGEQDPMWRPW